MIKDVKNIIFAHEGNDLLTGKFELLKLFTIYWWVDGIKATRLYIVLPFFGT